MLVDLVKRSQPLPATAKLLILGCGYSGAVLARLIRAHGTPLLCTRREPRCDNSDLRFDSAAGIVPAMDALDGVTHVISTIPPTSAGEEPVLSTLLPLLHRLEPHWVGYLSTTGVYGDRAGEWVSEDDAPAPTQERSRKRLNCENAWRASGLPVQILRLPGIYGPGRSVLNTLKQGRARIIHKPDQVFCRIHVEDIAGACLHLMHRASQGQRPEVVNICDNRPAPSGDLIRLGASLMNQPPPAEECFEEAKQGMSAMARSFWSDNRRVSNQRLIRTLGYELLHPDFEVGLRDCWQQDALNQEPKETLAHQ